MKIKYTIVPEKFFGDLHDYHVVVTATDPDGTLARGKVGPFKTKDAAEIFIAESGGEV